MKTSSLTNLRGLVTNGAQVKVQIVKAINQIAMYSKRGPGYSAAADSMTTMLGLAVAAVKTYTRSASIALNSASGTLAASDVVPLTVTATWADASTQVVMRPASATITVAAGNAANNDTLTIGSRVYTFKTTLTGAANEIKIGAANTDTAANIKKAILAQPTAGTDYGTGTAAHDDVAASVSSNVVTVFARAFAETNNSYAIAKSAANITLSAATLSGGIFDGRVTFSTSDATKAVVSTGGRITRVAAGSATITASFQGRTTTYAATLS